VLIRVAAYRSNVDATVGARVAQDLVSNALTPLR
jgi:hypothetical protein